MKFADNQFITVSWGNTLTLTCLAATMVVNTLVTGLIVFRIFKVYLEVKRLRSEATSFERRVSSLSSTGGAKFQHIMFVIIESGMALLAIQLVRVVLQCLQLALPTSTSIMITLNSVISIHEMLNVIIKSVHFVLLLFY